MDILLAQQKGSDAVAFLDSEPATKSFRIRAQHTKLRLDLLKEMGKKDEAKRLCYELLSLRPDDWDAWRDLLDISASTDCDAADQLQLKTYIEQKASDADLGTKKRRAAMLAELEYARINAAGSGKQSVLPVLERYLKNFGANYHLLGDIASSLSTLDEESRKALQLQLADLLPIGDIGREANKIKIERFLGAHSQLSNQQLENLSIELWTMFLECINQKCSPQDQQHVEDLALLCGHVCYDLLGKTGVEPLYLP